MKTRNRYPQPQRDTSDGGEDERTYEYLVSAAVVLLALVLLYVKSRWGA